jgi:hypothetical protein
MRPGSYPECALKMLIVLGSVSHQNDEAAGVHTRQSFEEHFVGHFWLVRPVSSTSTGPLVLGLTVLCALGEICQDQLLSWGVSWSADRLGLFYVDQEHPHGLCKTTHDQQCINNTEVHVTLLILAFASQSSTSSLQKKRAWALGPPNRPAALGVNPKCTPKTAAYPPI